MYILFFGRIFYISNKSKYVAIASTEEIFFVCVYSLRYFCLSVYIRSIDSTPVEDPALQPVANSMVNVVYHGRSIYRQKSHGGFLFQSTSAGHF